MTAYLAFDLGASSSRAMLGRLDGGVMEVEELHRFATPIGEEGGHLVWDVDEIWGNMQEGIRLGLDAAPNLRSVSVDSWAVDYVPLDGAGRPLRLPFCYRDSRTTGVMERAFEILPAEEIYTCTGIQFLPFNTLYQLIAGPEEADRYLTIADFFNFRLSGRMAIEVSMASTTQMMDVRTRRWSAQLMHAFGLDVRRWPDIVESGSRLGPLLQEPRVTVVASCSHDTGCAVAAAPAADPQGEWAFISCGTWSLLGVELREPQVSDEARRAGFTNEAGIDGSTRFLKNLTGLWALQECAREWGEVDWSVLLSEARAAKPEIAEINLEDPRFLTPGNMEGRLRAYCLERNLTLPKTRGELVRAILESIAASYHRALEDVERLTKKKYPTIHLVGGGSRNRMLCELTAEACDVRVVAGPVEATALGNLLIQARAMGDVPGELTIRDVAARSCETRVYSPSVKAA